MFVLQAEKICLGLGVGVGGDSGSGIERGGWRDKSGLFVEYTVKDCYHPN